MPGDLLCFANSKRGSNMSFSNWVCSDFLKIRGSSSIFGIRMAFDSGICCIIWCAIVATSGLVLSRVGSVRQKKNRAIGISFLRQSSTIDLAMADFPPPAAPFSHKIHWILVASSVIHAIISCRMAIRVFGWHLAASQGWSESNAFVDTCSWICWNPSDYTDDYIFSSRFTLWNEPDALEHL